MSLHSATAAIYNRYVSGFPFDQLKPDAQAAAVKLLADELFGESASGENMTDAIAKLTALHDLYRNEKLRCEAAGNTARALRFVGYMTVLADAIRVLEGNPSALAGTDGAQFVGLTRRQATNDWHPQPGEANSEQRF